MATPHANLTAGLVRYHESGEHSDCTIICGSYHFNVHKVVVGAQSDFFRAALHPDTFKEGKTSTIELKAKKTDSDDNDDDCDEPEIVKLMIHYFYHLDYLQSSASKDTTKAKKVATPKKRVKKAQVSSTSSLQSDVEVHLVEHVKLFAMAVKYHIEPLQNLTVEKFSKEANDHWNHQDFVEAVLLAYTTTSDEVTQLREVALRVFSAHCRNIIPRADVRSLLSNVTSLAHDLLMREYAEEYVPCRSPSTHGKKSIFTAQKCDSCSHEFMVCETCQEASAFLCSDCADLEASSF